MKYLKAFIKQENTYCKLFNRKPYDATNLSEKDCQALLDILDARLSPENLTEDGELRGDELRHKARLLYKIRDDLEMYAVEHHYSIISVDY
jgi:hypothetical protein